MTLYDTLRHHWLAQKSEGREWGVGSVLVDSAFLGRPDFQSSGPKTLILKVSEQFGAKSGAPQTQIQRPRIQRPILGPLKKFQRDSKSVVLYKGGFGGCAFMPCIGYTWKAHVPSLSLLSLEFFGPYPQYGWHFPEEIPEKFRKDPGNALRAFPGIPLESTAGMPQTL